MKNAIYTMLFWPGFIAGWAVQCLKLGYAGGVDAFGSWGIEYTKAKNENR